jgi:hypothetical protein
MAVTTKLTTPIRSDQTARPDCQSASSPRCCIRRSLRDGGRPLTRGQRPLGNQRPVRIPSHDVCRATLTPELAAVAMLSIIFESRTGSSPARMISGAIGRREAFIQSLGLHQSRGRDSPEAAGGLHVSTAGPAPLRVCAPSTSAQRRQPAPPLARYGHESELRQVAAQNATPAARG